MQSNDPEAPQSASTSAGTEPAPAGGAFARGVLNRPIEVISSGTGTTNDPSGMDKQTPPGVAAPGAGA